MKRLIEEIREIEFERIKYDQESEQYFDIQEGNIPILISAPHGARHFRKDKWKEEDEYTSSIAIKLGQATGAHVIYVKNKTVEDPNYIRKSRYKDSVGDIIKRCQIRFLLDIHGANKNKPFKICVGTRYDEEEKSSCPTFKNLIEKSLVDFQEPPVFNRPYYRATKKETITSFARRECGIESAQIEINAGYRIVERKPDSSKAVTGEEPVFKAQEKDVLDVFDHLRRMVLTINKEIDAGRRDSIIPGASRSCP
jgi:hypothetical protein